MPEQQAVPEQLDLHQRIAEVLDATFTSVDDFDAEVAAAAVLAALQPELAELAALREQLAAAKAAGYRLAADNAAELRQLHGADYDTDMLIHSLRIGAELREQAATDPALVQYARATLTTNKTLRDALAAITRQHHAVPYFDRTICDACSPQRHNGERYNLLITIHPCPTYTTAHNALKDTQ